MRLPDRENEIIALVTYIHHKIGFRDPPLSFLDFVSAFPNYEFQAGEMPRGFNGEILIKGAVRIVRYRSGSKPNTNRFSIGHEIGHGFLHEDAEFQCKVSSSFSIFKKPSGSAKEWEADFFSSELLMPMPVLNRMVGQLADCSEPEFRKETARQADIFGVTVSTMRTRLEDLTKMREWEGEFL